MSIIEDVVGIFAPHICVGCGAEEDKLLCEYCASTMAVVPSRCYHCKAVTDDYAVCRDCRPRTALRQVVVFTHHRELAKELIHSMKYERAQAGIREAASLMAAGLPCLSPDIVLTHVPTATSRIRMRGYDHARLLARELGRRNDIAYATHLSRVGQAHQVGSSRAERLRQLQGAFRIVKSASLRGKHIVLVDDVLTTGATLETAALELKRAGAARVSAIVFAQA